MGKRKAKHSIHEMNAAKGQNYTEEISNEPLTEMQKHNNKKRKKNQ